MTSFFRRHGIDKSADATQFAIRIDVHLAEDSAQSPHTRDETHDFTHGSKARRLRHLLAEIVERKNALLELLLLSFKFFLVKLGLNRLDES